MKKEFVVSKSVYEFALKYQGLQGGISGALPHQTFTIQATSDEFEDLFSLLRFVEAAAISSISLSVARSISLRPWSTIGSSSFAAASSSTSPTSSASTCCSRRGVGDVGRADDRAKTGDVACEFHSTQQESSNMWRLRARCVNGSERWNANVRLTRAGSKLTWSSKRGTTTYVRCRR
jgi:hypothetical protein